jgi:Spy/CpxP family protein refolding chaperone
MRKSLALAGLCGAVVAAALGGASTRGQDAKKGTAPARVIPVEKMAVPVDADDALVRQWEGQFGPQLRQVFRGELHLMRLVCEPTKAEYDKVAAKGDAIVKAAIRRYALAMQGRGGNESNPRDPMMKEIAKAVAEALTPEQSARYEKELALRTKARKRLVVSNLVAITDRVLVLTPEQRDKLSRILEANWDESWNQTQILMYGGQYFPSMPDAKIEPILTESQRTVWRGIQKNQIRFGVNFGFGVGFDMGEEVWDDTPPAERPGNPAAKTAPKNGAAPKADAKR